MKRYILYFCLLLSLLSLTGCRSSKVTTTMGKEELSLAKDRYELVVNRNFDYQFLQAKMKYSLGGRSLSGKLNIEHGKRLCMTVSVLGIEVARVEANQESVLIVDKFDKVYAKASIAEAAAKLGLEDEAKLEAVEALLLGRIFVPGRGLAVKGDFNKFAWYPMENKELQADLQAPKYQLSYILNEANYLVATQVKVTAEDPTQSGSTFVWEYASPVEVEGGSMPTAETLSIAGSREMSAQLSISSPAVSKKGWNSFNPTSGYRQVSFVELMDIIKNIKN